MRSGPEQVMIGQQVSHYKILDELGSGGMGIVYRAEDTRLGRIVALKFLSSELTRDTRARERLVNEARAASALDHPNICTIHEIEETEDGRVFLVLACYDGETARERLTRGCMPVREAVGVGLHVARGLEKAHAKGIIHRDIKPANVFITNEGIAKILDFGLAKHVGQTRVTSAGSTVGTVAYMSPEQAHGGEVDGRTDIWSFGALLYECLTGESPFKGDHPQTVLYSIIHDDPKPVLRLREDTPPELAALVTLCLDKNRKRRPSAQEVVRALEGLPQSPSSGPSVIRARTTTQIPIVVRRRRTAGLLATVVLASCIGLVATPAGRSAMRSLFGQDSLPGMKLLAVLPFTAAGEADAFALGFGQYLSLRFAQMEQLDPQFRVIPPSEVSRNKIDSPARALAISGATLAAVGNVSRLEDVVSMRIDVVETQSGRTLRSWSRDERAANVSALQSDAAASLAELLGVARRETAAEVAETGTTTLPAAFDAYIEGLGVLWSGTEDTARIAGGAEGVNERAVALLERATEIDPAYALAHAALGEACMKGRSAAEDQECLERAAAASHQAISLGDRLASPHVTLGAVYRLRREYERARAELERALEIDPLHWEAWNELSLVGTESDDEGSAEAAYLEAVDLRKDYWRCYYDLAVFYHDAGRDSEAVDWLTRASGVAPGNPDVYSALGVIYYYTDRRDEALKMFEQSVDVDPSWEGYNNLGTLYFSEAEYADAIRMYENALECDESQYSVWGNLAAAYNVRDGGGERALECYRRAATLCEPVYRKDPDDPHVLVHLASYYTEIGTPHEALELVTRAIELAPDDGEVAFQAGHTYEVLEEREMALSWIEKALECGYSQKVIEDTPALRELCTDARYRSLVQRGSDDGGT